jgi:hypothetical protein
MHAEELLPMTTDSDVQAVRRLAAAQGLRLSKKGEDFYLIDAETNDIVLGWAYPGGVHLDEVKAYLGGKPRTRTA